jgi:hypothetical protein
MKKLIILPFTILFLSACGQIKNNETTYNNIISIRPNNNGVIVYRFKNKLYDLEKLIYIDTSQIKSYIEIKRENVYADMFWREPNNNKTEYKNDTFELKENKDVTIRDNKGNLIKTITDPDKKILADNISGNSVIFSVSTGVVVAIHLKEENGYHIIKYDENGNTLNTWKIAHTMYEKEDNENNSIPYLYYFAHTDNAIIFSSTSYYNPKETIIQSLKDSTQTKIENATGGIIVNPKDNSLAGTIEFSDKIMEVKMGKTIWKVADDGWGMAAKTVLIDSILVIARYHNIATGCFVKAYQANTGKLLWTGDVKQLNVGHSKYFNIVHLTLYKDKLILEGNEAYGDYLQILDLKTGKNLFADMPENKNK